MKVERVVLHHVKMPLVHPFETSFSREYEVESIIVQIFADGLVGWGESAAESNPYYTYETVDTAWSVIPNFIVPRILGKEIVHPLDFWGIVRRIRGHNMAKAGVEAALWDIWSQEQNMPLWKAMGGDRDYIVSGVSIGIEPEVSILLDRIEKFLAEGYQRIKLKIKPGWDVDMLREVRRLYPDVPLMVDANAAYSIEDAERLKKLDEFNLMMIEQPMSYEDLTYHAQLQKMLETPICLDESIGSFAMARQALELGSCRIINIKAARMGGPSQGIAVHDLCMMKGVPVWCGGLNETGIGRLHNVALSTLPNFKLPGDVSASKKYYQPDLIEPEVEMSPDGTIKAPTVPGLGAEVREDALKMRRVRMWDSADSRRGV